MKFLVMTILAVGLFMCLVYLYHQKNVSQRESFANGDVCTLTLDNINPLFVKNYNQLNGKTINCFNKLTAGYCVGGNLKVIVNPAEVDENGIPKEQKQYASIANSNGSKTPANALIPVDPLALSQFFCLD